MTKETKQAIVVRSDLKMVRGKEDAQVAHASGAFVFRQLREQIAAGKTELRVFLTQAERDWIMDSYAKVVLVAHSEEELAEIKRNAEQAGVSVHEIIDAGRTQFDGVPTRTCIAIGPDYVNRIDPVTGKLRLR
jgi:PTH2 family peptidyl-tRNA hydrolase